MILILGGLMVQRSAIHPNFLKNIVLKSRHYNGCREFLLRISQMPAEN